MTKQSSWLSVQNIRLQKYKPHISELAMLSMHLHLRKSATFELLWIHLYLWAITLPLFAKLPTYPLEIYKSHSQLLKPRDCWYISTCLYYFKDRYRKFPSKLVLGFGFDGVHVTPGYAVHAVYQHSNNILSLQMNSNQYSQNFSTVNQYSSSFSNDYMQQADRCIATVMELHNSNESDWSFRKHKATIGAVSAT